jgi:hypothetical protein
MAPGPVLRPHTQRARPNGFPFRPSGPGGAKRSSPVAQRIQGIELLRERAGVNIDPPHGVALEDIGDVGTGLRVRLHGFNQLHGSVTRATDRQRFGHEVFGPQGPASDVRLAINRQFRDDRFLQSSRTGR